MSNQRVHYEAPTGRPTVFLDVDGVLNSVAWADGHFANGRPTRGGFIPPPTAELAIEERRIDPACVERLRRITRASGAQIVVASSWRTRMPLPEWKRLFELFGWSDAPLAGLTRVLPGVRGVEVAAWLDEHAPGVRYCILDDDDDFLETQRPSLVRTNADVGLTDADVLRCVHLLTGVSGVDRDLILRAAEQLCGSQRDAAAWMQRPVPEFDGMTADELVRSGRGDAVLRLLELFEAGSLG